MPSMRDWQVIIKVVAKSVPAVCIVIGSLSLLGSCSAGLGFGVGLFGFCLVVAGVLLQILYLYWKYQR